MHLHPAASPQPTRPSPLFISELISLIFSFLDQRSIAKCALVSRQWCEVAIDILWYEVKDIRPLLTLLAPWVQEKRTATTSGSPAPPFIKWRRALRGNDWERFDYYAHRVRKLTIDDRRMFYPNRERLHKSIYEEMARTCPRADILPSVQHIKWCASTFRRQKQGLVFLHPALKRLTIKLHRSEDPPLSEYVASILERVPELPELEITSERPVHEVEEEMVTLLTGLRHMRKVVLPMYFTSSTTLSRLSIMSNLEEIEFAVPVELGTGDINDLASFAPVLQEGAFPSLRSLCFSASLPHTIQFLRNPFFPQQLTSLTVNMLTIENPDLLHRFLSIAADNIPLLTDLHVDYVLDPQTTLVYPPLAPTDRPTLDTIRPVLRWKRLITFELRWDYELTISEADLEELASSWPHLENLFLNAEPVPEQSPPVFTLGALIPFARHCPRLQKLALFMDARRVPPVAYPAALQPFQALRQLSLGSSVLTVSEPAILFLSQILPLGCSIISGVRWPDAYGIALDKAGVTEDRKMRIQESWIRWNDVARLLPLAIKVRLEEKKTIAALQQEMEALYVSRRQEQERREELEREVQELRSRQ